ncbi:GntR family transcriptional regulator [Agromyces tropicus]|uniref:GntR family transcriptional regulator n=1 Tax=Agromyces tropicus TaxID=555371 RepID=A0ABN2USJ5_9MICO
MSNELSVTPIAQPPSLRERVEAALASAIRSGEMKPGELFSAPTLAARFDVSATPVREAMLNLEKQGFVEIVRNKGFRVTRVSDRDLQDLVEVRQLLEPPVARLVAGRIPAEEYPRLRSLAGRIVDGAARGSLADYLEADAEFHRAVTDFTGNPRLSAVVSDLRAQTRLPGLADLIATEELSASANEHLELLELLEAGDGEAAEELMRRHLAHVIGWWAGRPEDG